MKYKQRLLVQVDDTDSVSEQMVHEALTYVGTYLADWPDLDGELTITLNGSYMGLDIDDYGPEEFWWEDGHYIPRTESREYKAQKSNEHVALVLSNARVAAEHSGLSVVEILQEIQNSVENHEPLPDFLAALEMG